MLAILFLVVLLPSGHPRLGVALTMTCLLATLTDYRRGNIRQRKKYPERKWLSCGEHSDSRGPGFQWHHPSLSTFDLFCLCWSEISLSFFSSDFETTGKILDKDIDSCQVVPPP